MTYLNELADTMTRTLPASVRPLGRTYLTNDVVPLFFAEPDGMKLELVHNPWGYWRKVMTDGSDPRPRHESK